MPSALYNQVNSLISSYLGPEKAAAVMERQLPHCAATPETFVREHLDKIRNRLIGASTLWLPPEKQASLTSKLRTIG